MRPVGSAEERERVRRRGVSLLDQGWSTSEVAAACAVDARSVRRWQRQYAKGGSAALAPSAPSGRPPKLSAAQRRGLVCQLLKGPLAHGYDNDLWTCRRIAQLIHRRYQVSYHPGHIPKLLGKLDWSVQKPEKQAKERDEQAIRRWMQEDWPRIVKRGGGSGLI